jgi:hypothetical protein
MKDPVPPLFAAVLLYAAASFLPTVSGADQPVPVVVELFTSQGCNSCPPADVVLGELTLRDDVLPLSFHVTYWDRLGWPDTFGLPASTSRQRDYADTLGRRGVYTPQMVIGGRIDVVGSQRGRVLEAIELLRSDAESGPQITIADGALRLAAGEASPCSLWLVAFDRARDVAIERGENRGLTLRYHNVVRDIVDLGGWDGAALVVPLPLEALAREKRDAAAVLVQRRADGAIIAALRIDLPSS